MPQCPTVWPSWHLICYDACTLCATVAIYAQCGYVRGSYSPQWHTACLAPDACALRLLEQLQEQAAIYL
jgi:hypothetical protein